MQERSLAKKANKVEKMKLQKAGHRAWEDVQELGRLVRAVLCVCVCVCVWTQLLLCSPQRPALNTASLVAGA